MGLLILGFDGFLTGHKTAGRGMARADKVLQLETVININCK